jgi:hypothetical protein
MTDDSVVRPGDVLPDGVDATVIDGLTVRKGSVAAFVANATNLERLHEDSPAYRETVDALRSLVPALRAVGVLDVFEPRSPRVRDIVDEA